jgi:Carboxypeptidase regulatory-like domain
MRRKRFALFVISLAATTAALASVFGSVRGVIHDPQHRPVQNARVMIKAKNSDWSATVNSDSNGNFTFTAVPLGEYVVSVAAVGFEQTQQSVVVISGTEPVLHFALKVAGAKETINVSAAAETAPTDSTTPTTLISRARKSRRLPAPPAPTVSP